MKLDDCICGWPAHVTRDYTGGFVAVCDNRECPMSDMRYREHQGSRKAVAEAWNGGKR